MKNILIIMIVLISLTRTSIAATSLVFTGQGYITQDQTYSYDDLSCSVNAFCFNSTNEDDIVFFFQTKNVDTLHWWYTAFSKAGERLHVGRYENATRWHTGDFTNPTFSITGDGRGSNTISGWFEILEIEMNPDRSQVISFATDFMQYNEGVTSSWTFGSLRYNSNIPTTIPESGPVMVSLLSLLLFLVRRRLPKTNK